MTDREILYQNILLDPHADTPRLVYADYIEEHCGEAVRAEFIRVQCEFPRTPQFFDELRNTLLGHIQVVSVSNQKFQDLVQREKEIADKYCCNMGPWSKDFLKGVLTEDLGVNMTHTVSWQWFFVRGFVDSILMPLQDFKRHSFKMFKTTPITKVTLHGVVRDKTIFRGGFHGSDDDLPESIFCLLRTQKCTDRVCIQYAGTHCHYGERFQAEDDLSQACVRLGRQLAGLEK